MQRGMFVRRTLVLAAALLGLLVVPTGASAAGGSCTKVAAPGGSDGAAGSAGAPYASVQQLVSSLGPGETGCLRQGTYGGSDIRVDQPGATLTSYPGERATITAFMEVYPQATGARVSGLKFDSKANGNAAAVKLQADNTVFSDNDVTKGGDGICVIAGSWKNARNVTIERNRIHDCGAGGSKYDHQIYLAGTRNAVVRWNILSKNNGGWGVHMYPDADGTLVEHNIIDGNQGGVVFAGEGGTTSDNNVVRDNAITFSGPRWNIESSWSGGPTGSANEADHNCVYSGGPDGPGGIGERDGFSASSNTVLGGSPYMNRGANDYRFRADSPCLALVGDVEGAISGHPSAVPAPPVTVVLKPAVPVVSHGATVVLKGQVKVPAARSKGKAKVSRVAVQVRRGKHWTTVKVKRVRGRGGRFSVRMRAKGKRRQTMRLRAVVPNVASSRVVRLRVR
jgi:hypothetical protein